MMHRKVWEAGTSKELKRELERIDLERELKTKSLQQAKLDDLKENKERYEMVMNDIRKEMNEKKRVLQSHILKELNMIKKRATNYKKSCERAFFSVKETRRTDKGLVIDISISRKYSSRDIELEIDNVYNNWQHDINFNLKRTTRAASKNARKGTRGGQIDLHRLRYHLREDQVKYDLRQLLDKEAEFDERYADLPNISNRFGINIHDSRIVDRNINGRDGSIDFDSEITNAFHQLPTYTDRHHISGITTKLGFLNDPDISDPLFQRSSRRRTTTRVNYQSIEDNDNQNMYHAQEVYFNSINSDNLNDNILLNGSGGVGSKYNERNGGRGNNNNIKTHYKNTDGINIEIPTEERGNNVTVAGFQMCHGTIVRLNYNMANTTIDARVVSIKKNQLSAVTLVGGKRKRIWYKELRQGKINIVPATAYR